jgi:hypothetical protein
MFGWAVALACHQTDIPIHVFDLKSNVWHIWVEDKFHPAQEPSPPSGTYTGIGSRKLTDAGIEAIGKLYGIEEMIETLRQSNFGFSPQGAFIPLHGHSRNPGQ